jgi:hypothetical protein
VPTAEVIAEGEVRAGMSRHDALAPRLGMDNYLFAIGFAPGLWTSIYLVILLALAVLTVRNRARRMIAEAP